MTKEGNIFKKIRTDRGIKQNFVADKINFSKEYLSNLENDEKPMSLEAAKRLLNFYTSGECKKLTVAEIEEIHVFLFGKNVMENFVSTIQNKSTHY